MIAERILVIVCNACSSQCGSESEFEINGERVGNVLPFCYLGMPAKESDDNVEKLYQVRYKEECMNCTTMCCGHIYSVAFAKCVKTGCKFSAEVVNL